MTRIVHKLKFKRLFKADSTLAADLPPYSKLIAQFKEDPPYEAQRNDVCATCETTLDTHSSMPWNGKILVRACDKEYYIIPKE